MGTTRLAVYPSQHSNMSNFGSLYPSVIGESSEEAGANNGDAHITPPRRKRAVSSRSPPSGSFTQQQFQPDDEVALALRRQEEENAYLLQSLTSQVSAFGGKRMDPPAAGSSSSSSRRGHSDAHYAMDEEAASLALAMQLQAEEDRMAEEESDSDEEEDDDDGTLALALRLQAEEEERNSHLKQQSEPDLEEESLALARMLQQEEEERLKALEQERLETEKKNMELAKRLQMEEESRLKSQARDNKDALEKSTELARRLQYEEEQRKIAEQRRKLEIEAQSLELARQLQDEEEKPDAELEEESKGLAAKLAMEEKKILKTASADSDDSATLAMRLQEAEGKQILLRQTTDEMSLAVAQRLQNEEVFAGSTLASGVSQDAIRRTLEPCQWRALTFVEERARGLHEAALPLLRGRAAALGYPTNSVDRCLAYIREDAPIIVHLKEDVLTLLTKDTHYRNLFETNTSGGSNNPSGRLEWESTLFGNSYETGCEGSLRPKYGCLNVTGDVRGCAKGRYYGPLYITLHRHVRYRATMSDKDTGGRHDALATCDHYAHVLNRYHDSDLCALLDVSTSAARRIGGASSSGVATYKEVQIHGPVDLSTDVEALSVPGSHRTASAALKKSVEEFQKRSGCNVMWQDDLFDF
uniref:Uncharacterized protein n=1 Tax=Entomoneis paludosa TaxID=265537 RepID=A0A7S2Y6K0_9STRA